MRTMLLLIICAAGFSACFSQTSAPPAVRGQSDAQSTSVAINELNSKLVDGCRNFDPDQTAALWDEDGVDLLPGMDPLVGKRTIQKWLKGVADQIKGAKILQCDVDWQRMQVAGDVAYEWGINTQTVQLPDRSEPMKNKGKITLILRRQADGGWKIALESWNSSPRPSGQ